jgi:acyl-CoA thioesterase I
MKLFAVGIAVLVLFASLAAYSFVTQLSSAKPIIRVACIGDSITIGIDNESTTYPDDLAALLGANYQVVNFGVGRTTVSLDFDKPYIYQDENKLAHAFEPNIVVIMLGTNDAYLGQNQRGNFTSDYKTLIDSFQTLASKPKVFIVIPPPVFTNSLELNGTIVENDIIPLIRQTASNLNLPLIDAHTVLLNHPEDFKDGVHPNSQGSEVIAKQIFNVISQTSYLLAH